MDAAVTRPASLPALGAPASAPAGLRLGVFPFEGFGLPPELEMAPVDLEARVRGLLEKAGHAVESPAMFLRDMVGVYGCGKLDEGCMALIASGMGVDRIIVGKLEAVEGAAEVRVRVRVYRGGGTPVEIDRVVPATLEGLAEGFDAVAREVVREAVAEPPASMPESTKAGGLDVGPASAPGPMPAETKKRFLRFTGAGLVTAGALAAGTAVWMGARWFAARRVYREGVADWSRPGGLLDLPLDGPVNEGDLLCHVGPGPIEDATAAELTRRGVFDACRRGRISSIVGWSAAGAGAALIAVGAALLVAGRRRFRPALGSVAPFIGPGSFGLTLRAEFR
ncbi:MAG TPA: hypothetical protein VLJ37_02830 [bacterium]|nr:hypothetical protein [bacterium]